MATPAAPTHESTSEAPAWPPWYAGVAFLVALFGTFLAVGILAAATGVEPDDEDAAFTIVATLVQSAVFAGTAVVFASMTAPPRPWHFGLRPISLRRAAGWALAGMAAFYVLAGVYGALVHPDTEQQVTESLGANNGTIGLIAAGVMVILVAPAAEEFFFRGFFYRALRTRYPMVAAALIDGALFGVIHYDFSGADALLILPPLAVLGFTFCLVYERTGSLFTVMAMHAVNNTIAYAVQAEAWEVSAVLGPVALLAAVTVPRLLPPAPRPLPAS